MPLTDEQTAQAARLMTTMRDEIAKAVIGQSAAIEQCLMSLAAGGHVLLEGVPGLGKTLLVCAIAKTFDGSFGRIQFTPDLMPSDVTGHSAYAQPFMVLATQDPVEQEGTYPLPEAQLDRFLMKIKIDYPSHADEVALTRSVTLGKTGDTLAVEAVQTLLKPQTVQTLRQMSSMVDVGDVVLDYAVRIVRKTREFAGISSGAGSRGALALVRAARALALMGGRNYVTPDDVKCVAPACLRHRIRPAPELEIEGRDGDSLLAALFEQVPAPRQ